jgi:hypothetical protein
VPPGCIGQVGIAPPANYCGYNGREGNTPLFLTTGETAMGGPGSGNRTNHHWHQPARLAVEDVIRLDPRTVTESGEWRFVCRDGPMITLRYDFDPWRRRVTLTHLWERPPCPYEIDLERWRQPRGGTRWYWICPVCERRRDALYLPPGQAEFACRRCSNLTHRSTKECGKHRALYRSLASRLSCQVDDVDALFRKQRGRDRPLPLHPCPPHLR